MTRHRVRTVIFLSRNVAGFVGLSVANPLFGFAARVFHLLSVNLFFPPRWGRFLFSGAVLWLRWVLWVVSVVLAVSSTL